LGISDSFVEYGPHVYSMAIKYNVSSDDNLWWLTSAAEEVLMANAARLFEHFEELLIVSFSMQVSSECEWTPAFHWMTVHRENIA